MTVDCVLEVKDLTAGIDFNQLGQITKGDGFRDQSNRPNLAGEIRCEFVDYPSEFAPCALEYQCLTAEFAVGLLSVSCQDVVEVNKTYQSVPTS
jgi:hypothetical protein